MPRAHIANRHLDCTSCAEAARQTRGCCCWENTPAKDFNDLPPALSLGERKVHLFRSYSSKSVCVQAKYILMLMNPESKIMQHPASFQTHPTPARRTVDYHLFMGWVIPKVELGEGHAGWGRMGRQRSRSGDHDIIAERQEPSKLEFGWHSEIMERRYG